MKQKWNDSLQHLFKSKNALLAALALALAPTLTYGQTQSGTLDASFGVGGTVITDLGGTAAARALAVQPDGKIVAAGLAFINDVSNVALARYNTNGTLDTSFGTGGTVATPFSFPGSFGGASSVALQADGKIVLAGSTVLNPFAVFALARFNSNGTLDASFGTGGIVTTAFGQVSAQAWTVGVQADGKIVAAGYSNTNGGHDFALARYNTNGTLDATFGTGGKVSTSIHGSPSQGFSYAEVNSVTFQPDGRIVAAGDAEIGSCVFNGLEQPCFDFALARYNSNGTLDTSFGAGGTLTTDFASPNGHAYSVAVQPDGRIVVAGAAGRFVNRGFDFGLARYNSNGTLDASFGTGGKTTTDFGDFDDVPTVIALQGDGKIVVVGRTAVSSASDTFDFALARYNSNGTLDSSFGTTGKVTTDFVGSSDQATSVALQADGKIVAAGGVDFNGHFEFALARYDVGLDQPAPTPAPAPSPAPAPAGATTSPDGTTVPPAAQIVDNAGAVWTIGANQSILRNGALAAGGFGSRILWRSSTIYVLGTDNNWYQFTGSGWVNVGPVQPGVTGTSSGTTGASPDGTTVPAAAQIVDNAGGVWTIGANHVILRNGVQAASGFGSQILWKSGTIYVLGTDNNWYRWTGAGWTNVGPARP